MEKCLFIYHQHRVQWRKISALKYKKISSLILFSVYMIFTIGLSKKVTALLTKVKIAFRVSKEFILEKIRSICDVLCARLRA
jgi:hypothetical protein